MFEQLHVQTFDCLNIWSFKRSNIRTWTLDGSNIRTFDRSKVQSIKQSNVQALKKTWLGPPFFSWENMFGHPLSHPTIFRASNFAGRPKLFGHPKNLLDVKKVFGCPQFYGTSIKRFGRPNFFEHPKSFWMFERSNFLKLKKTHLGPRKRSNHSKVRATSNEQHNHERSTQPRTISCSVCSRLRRLFAVALFLVALLHWRRHDLGHVNIRTLGKFERSVIVSFEHSIFWLFKRLISRTFERLSNATEVMTWATLKMLPSIAKDIFPKHVKKICAKHLLYNTFFVQENNCGKTDVKQKDIFL